MKESLLACLCCPFCGGDLKLKESHGEKVADEVTYGILSCYCGQYPIVAGIPILQKEPRGVISELVSLIGRRLQKEVLVLAVSLSVSPPSSPNLAPAWIKALPSVKGFNRLKHIAHLKGVREWRREAVEFLNQNGRGSAGRLLAFFFQDNKETFNYFAFRFGQPRHLVALSFASIIEQPIKPILDLACGQGHIARTLLRRAKNQPVIGADPNFLGLYIAKTYIAPEAEYVCCVTDGPLPFPDGFFSVAFCSDAFHYFVKKAANFRELKRLTKDDGLIVLTWVHNVLLRCPHDGLPLPPEGYQALVADMPHRLVADSDVLSRYLQKQGPPLACPTEIERLAHEPLLSIVASHRQEVFKDYGCFEEWPHAEGRLGLNPLYIIDEKSGDSPGDVQLLRMFPSAFYIEDHAQSREYLPETVKAHSQVLDDLACGKRTPEMERLIEQFVVLGMPEH